MRLLVAAMVLMLACSCKQGEDLAEVDSLPHGANAVAMNLPGRELQQVKESLQGEWRLSVGKEGDAYDLDINGSSWTLHAESPSSGTLGVGISLFSTDYEVAYPGAEGDPAVYLIFLSGEDAGRSRDMAESLRESGSAVFRIPFADSAGLKRMLERSVSGHVVACPWLDRNSIGDDRFYLSRR